MAANFITGSADGLGQLAARRLVALGHDVVLHGRRTRDPAPAGRDPDLVRVSSQIHLPSIATICARQDRQHLVRADHPGQGESEPRARPRAGSY